MIDSFHPSSNYSIFQYELKVYGSKRKFSYLLPYSVVLGLDQ